MIGKKNRYKIIIIGSDAGAFLNFRKELVLDLISSGFSPHILVPDASKNNDLKSFCIKNSITFSDFMLDRYSMNIFKEFISIFQIILIFAKERPQIILSYTIKPNFYALIAAFLTRVPLRFTLVTGLGYFLRTNKKSSLKKALIKVYGFFLRKSNSIFFQNHDDIEAFKSMKLISSSQDIKIIPGSGVNLDYFKFKSIPDLKKLSFLFIGRLLIDKGILDFLNAAIAIGTINNEIMFKVLGWIEQSDNSISEKDLVALESQKNIELIKKVSDVRPIIESCHVLVHPSYHEGMPRSVLEAMSIGRPIITTDAPGCRESIIDNFNGYIVKSGDVESLIKAIKIFINQKDLIKIMSHRSRKLAEEKFDVKIVNKAIIETMISKLPTV